MGNGGRRADSWRPFFEARIALGLDQLGSRTSDEDYGALLKRITEVIADSTILRLKGFANVVGSSSRLLIQAVGPRMNSYFDRPWKSGENRATRLVVIGVKGMDQQAITAALQG